MISSLQVPPPKPLHPTPPHNPWFNHPNNIWWAVEILNSSLRTFILSTLTFSLSGPNIFLSNCLKHHWHMFFLWCKRPSFTLTTATHTVGFCILAMKHLTYNFICLSKFVVGAHWRMAQRYPSHTTELAPGSCSLPVFNFFVSIFWIAQIEAHTRHSANLNGHAIDECVKSILPSTLDVLTVVLLRILTSGMWHSVVGE